MTLGNWQFKPKAWASILYLSIFLCMLWLANWQLERAALKVSLQQAAELAHNSPAIPLSELDDYPGAAASYQRVAITGQYDPARQFLWDNRSHKSQAGFEVISVINRVDGGLALVNRGWVAPGPSRQQLPDVSLPEPAITAELHIEGFVSQPSKGFSSGPAVAASETWPKLLQYVDFAAIAQALGEPVVPVLVQAQTLGADANTASVLTSRPEWLIANWQPAASGPAKHYSYAFQWFAMALALTGIFLVVNIQRVNLQKVVVSDD